MFKMRTIVIMMSFLMAVSWGTYAQHGNHQTQKQTEASHAVFLEQKVTAAYEHYLDLQKALVQSDEERAQKAASQLQLELKEIETGQMALADALKVVKASSLAEQRKAFTALSTEMANFIKSRELKEGKVYLGYCPMANGNTGGSWLASSSEIRNPYFGDKMLKCGTIKEVIE